MEQVKEIKGHWDIAVIELKKSDEAAARQASAMMGQGWEPFQIFWKHDVTSITDKDLRDGYYAVALRRYVRVHETQSAT